MFRSIGILVVPMLILTFGSIDDQRPSSRPMGSRADANAVGDQEFAQKVWKVMKGYKDWKLTTGVFKGASPHGKWVRLYSTFVTVDGKDYPIIVKDNFGGRGVSQERIQKDPAAWLKAVTIMLKRESGYDTENKDWFWVKYDKDGKIAKHPKGMLLAGKPTGCISCHNQSGGADYLYSNDT